MSVPQLLNRPFIAIELAKKDYIKVKSVLPTPTIFDTSRNYDEVKLLLVYVLGGFVTSYKQYLWLSSIKLSLKNKIFVPFDVVQEYYISDNGLVDNRLYSLNELSLAFDAQKIDYIKGIYYPNDKKELYKWLVRHGKKLNHRKVLTKESLTGIALFMNRYLKDKLSDKEVHKKVTSCYEFIINNPDNFPQRLESKELKKAYIKGAKITNTKQSKETEKRIKKALQKGDYIKPNGKTNKTLLAKDLNLNRRTLDKYL